MGPGNVYAVAEIKAMYRNFITAKHSVISAIDIASEILSIIDIVWLSESFAPVDRQ